MSVRTPGESRNVSAFLRKSVLSTGCYWYGVWSSCSRGLGCLPDPSSWSPMTTAEVDRKPTLERRPVERPDQMKGTEYLFLLPQFKVPRRKRSCSQPEPLFNEIFNLGSLSLADDHFPCCNWKWGGTCKTALWMSSSPNCPAPLIFWWGRVGLYLLGKIWKNFIMILEFDLKQPGILQ